MFVIEQQCLYQDMDDQDLTGHACMDTTPRASPNIPSDHPPLIANRLSRYLELLLTPIIAAKDMHQHCSVTAYVTSQTKVTSPLCYQLKAASRITTSDLDLSLLAKVT